MGLLLTFFLRFCNSPFLFLLYPKHFTLLGPVFGEAFAEFGKGDGCGFYRKHLIPHIGQIVKRLLNHRKLQNMKTVLIEKTAKRLNFYELIIIALLFITLLSGFGALYIAIPLAIGIWNITGLCRWHLSVSALPPGGVSGKHSKTVEHLAVLNISAL